ncbi:MAG: hypothetical protein ACYDDA_14645, partial [Acidiferrobacteraceae bacterium]
MSTRELPDTEAKPMDEDHLVKLMYEAMVAVNDSVRGRTFTTEEVIVPRFDPSGPGIYLELFTRPSLHHARFDYKFEHMDSPTAQALMDYLWDHGGHRIPLNGEPTRSTWASHVFHEVIRLTLYELWDDHSIRSLSATGAWPPWEVPDEAIRQSAQEMASREVGKGARITITIPLC